MIQTIWDFDIGFDVKENSPTNYFIHFYFGLLDYHVLYYRKDFEKNTDTVTAFTSIDFHPSSTGHVIRKSNIF